MKYIVHRAAVERFTDIELAQFKTWFLTQVLEIGDTACEKVIDGHYGIPLCQQRVAKMRAEEPSSAGDQGTFVSHAFL